MRTTFTSLTKQLNSKSLTELISHLHTAVSHSDKYSCGTGLQTLWTSHRSATCLMLWDTMHDSVWWMPTQNSGYRQILQQTADILLFTRMKIQHSWEHRKRRKRRRKKNRNNNKIPKSCVHRICSQNLKAYLVYGIWRHIRNISKCTASYHKQNIYLFNPNP